MLIAYLQRFALNKKPEKYFKNFFGF